MTASIQASCWTIEHGNKILSGALASVVTGIMAVEPELSWPAEQGCALIPETQS